MMGSIQRRLGALEAAHGRIDFVVIERRIIEPGKPAGEVAFADLRGRRITRELAEPEGAFFARVHAWVEASASAGQRCATVVLTETDLRL